MSWLSKATGIHLNLKPLAPVIGGAVGSIIPGVGTALGAGLGSFLSGVGNKQGVGKSLLQGGASALGGGLLGAAGRFAAPLAAGAASTMGGGAGKPGAGGFQMPSMGQVGSGALGALGSAAGWLGENGGKNALGLAQGVNAAMLEKKAEDYAKNAQGSVQQSYNERAPLRAAGIQGMLKPQIPDLSGLTGMAGRNPYAIKPQGASPAPLVPIAPQGNY